MAFDFDACPLCGTQLSQTKYIEIQSKIKREEQHKLELETKRLSEATSEIRLRLELEFKKSLQVERATVVKHARQEAEQQIKSLEDERDRATKKAEESAAREIQIKKAALKEKETAAKLARKESEQRIKAIAAERDSANSKLKDAATRETETRKQLLAEAEKKREKELSEQRAAFEKDRTAAMFKQQAQFNREREAQQKKLRLMEQQIQKKTANELGDGAEIDIFEALREAFPGDTITRVKKGQPGADIHIEVLNKGQVCGRIIIDSKNHQGWQNNFVSKLRQDQTDAGAQHAILATTVFPAGKKELCIESGVIVIHPGRISHIVNVLRQSIVTMHVRGLSVKERSGKMTRLYELINSEPYGRKFSEAGKLAHDILDLDTQEKRSHDNVWKKRGAFALRINHVLREIETEVAAIIEDEVEVQEDFVQPLRSHTARQSSKLEETKTWKQ